MRPERTPDREATLEGLRAEVEAALERALPSETKWPATIHRAVRYSLFAGGKRIRPVLALAQCHAGQIPSPFPYPARAHRGSALQRSRAPITIDVGQRVGICIAPLLAPASAKRPL